jgi:ATP-dependent Zn protease
MEEAKSQIRQLVESRLQPGKFVKYGVVRNGILLQRPRGSGKTFLAEATAGEFDLNYYYLSSPALLNM